MTLPRDLLARMDDRPAVYVQAAAPLSGVRLMLVWAVDDRGREVPQPSTGSEGNQQFSFGLEPSSGAKTLDLTFAVVKSRFAEYITQPTRLKK